MAQEPGNKGECCETHCFVLCALSSLCGGLKLLEFVCFSNIFQKFQKFVDKIVKILFHYFIDLKEFIRINRGKEL